MDPSQAFASAKRPLEEARHALGDVGSQARRAFGDASHQAREAFGEMGSQARQAFDEMGNAIGPYRHTLEDAIVAHPVKAVGLALALGVFLGWLTKR